MPIPSLTTYGFLPVGIHECTLEEIGSEFGQFRSSNRRCELYDKLIDFLAEAHAAGQIMAVIVNGSFVSSKEEPGDIDLIVILSASHDFSAQIRPFEYNILSRRQVRKRYGLDVLVAQTGQTELDEYIEFFAQVRGAPDQTKGMLKVVL